MPREKPDRRLIFRHKLQNRRRNIVFQVRACWRESDYLVLVEIIDFDTHVHVLHLGRFRRARSTAAVSEFPFVRARSARRASDRPYGLSELSDCSMPPRGIPRGGPSGFVPTPEPPAEGLPLRKPSHARYPEESRHVSTIWTACIAFPWSDRTWYRNMFPGMFRTMMMPITMMASMVFCDICPAFRIL